MLRDYIQYNNTQQISTLNVTLSIMEERCNAVCNKCALYAECCGTIYRYVYRCLCWHCFSLISMTFIIKLKKKNIFQEWIFEECKNINAMQFRFKDKEKPTDLTSKVAARCKFLKTSFFLQAVFAWIYLLWLPWVE
jgi:hypothetical protein